MKKRLTKKEISKIKFPAMWGKMSWDYSKKNRNQKVLKSFVKFCEKNKDLRFYQALSAWTGKQVSLGEDTFFWESKLK